MSLGCGFMKEGGANGMASPDKKGLLHERDCAVIDARTEEKGIVSKTNSTCIYTLGKTCDEIISIGIRMHYIIFPVSCKPIP